MIQIYAVLAQSSVDAHFGMRLRVGVTCYATLVLAMLAKLL